MLNMDFVKIEELQLICHASISWKQVYIADQQSRELRKVIYALCQRYNLSELKRLSISIYTYIKTPRFRALPALPHHQTLFPVMNNARHE
jgi:hypothetical protein